jgi:hypothetical protein
MKMNEIEHEQLLFLLYRLLMDRVYLVLCSPDDWTVYRRFDDIRTAFMNTAYSASYDKDGDWAALLRAQAAMRNIDLLLIQYMSTDYHKLTPEVKTWIQDMWDQYMSQSYIQIEVAHYIRTGELRYHGAWPN